MAKIAILPTIEENMKFFRGLRMKRKMSSTAVVVHKQIVFDDST
jgi:hypothetical protein